MANNNEEDYLDQLLKSVTQNKNISVDELMNTQSPMQVPEEQLTSSAQPGVSDDVYAQMMMSPNRVEENYLDQQLQDLMNPGANVPNVVPTAPVEMVSDADLMSMAEPKEMPHIELTNEDVMVSDSPEQEEDMVDDYIHQVLLSEEDETVLATDADPTTNMESVVEPVTEPVMDQSQDSEKLEGLSAKEELEGFGGDEHLEEQFMEGFGGEEEPSVEETKYIDVSEGGDEAASLNLINALDDIISDVNDEVKAEAEAEKERAKKEEDAQAAAEEEAKKASEIDPASLDDEMKELLGMDENGDLSSMSTGELSDDEIAQISAMQEASLKEQEMIAEEEAQAALEAAMALQESSDNAEDKNSPELTLNPEGDLSGLEDIPDLDAKESNTTGGSGGELGSAQAVAEELDEVIQKAKKPGLLAKILGLLKKNKSQGEDAGSSEAKDENQKILEELYDADGNLIENKKPVKKGFFAFLDAIAEDDSEEEVKPKAEGEEGEEGGKKKKKKEKKPKEPKKKKEKKPKPPKPPKPKKEKPPKEPTDPKDIVHIRPIGLFVIVLIVGSTVAYLFFTTVSFGYTRTMNSATYYMVDKNYNKAWDWIAGVEPKNEADKELKERITCIMYVQHKYNAYGRYSDLHMDYEALSALITGIDEYERHYEEATLLGVSADLDAIRIKILDVLSVKYGISDEMAHTFAGLYNSDYASYQEIITNYSNLEETP
ncbi:MAG: hypothetical protein K6C69_03085 [Lachnospiraceae bacterium]|nr:hypothetical protein [Lachnospiraceae bacterium]